MSARARLYLATLLVSFVPALLPAQTWQPAAAPLVTAENETWFLSGEPIIWAGDYYFPAGARRHFNPYQMVRAGSFRGIPLYTDATLDPFSIVYVPVPGGLMQPYERRRTGTLAGTTGSTAPSFPPDLGAEGRSRPTGLAADIAQVPGPPAFARPYDVAPAAAAAPSAPPAAAPAVGTTGHAVPPPGRPGKKVGLASIWVDYGGQQWLAAGRPTEKPGPGFTVSDSYHGFPVYTREGDPETIYIPMVHGGLVTPYRRR